MAKVDQNNRVSQIWKNYISITQWPIEINLVSNDAALHTLYRFTADKPIALTWKIPFLSLFLVLFHSSQGINLVKPIVYGNISRYFGKKREEDGHTHQWTIYVKPHRNEVSNQQVEPQNQHLTI